MPHQQSSAAAAQPVVYAAHNVGLSTGMKEIIFFFFFL